MPLRRTEMVWARVGPTIISDRRDFVARILPLYRDMRHQDKSIVGADTNLSSAQSSMESAQQLATDSIEIALDDAIAASFPASDPPSWTPGIATVASASWAS